MAGRRQPDRCGPRGVDFFRPAGTSPVSIASALAAILCHDGIPLMWTDHHDVYPIPVLSVQVQSLQQELRTRRREVTRYPMTTVPSGTRKYASSTPLHCIVREIPKRIARLPRRRLRIELRPLQGTSGVSAAVDSGVPCWQSRTEKLLSANLASWRCNSAMLRRRSPASV